MSYIFRAKEFRTKKKLGQNFLIDKDVIQTILDAAQIRPEDTVVEIGGVLAVGRNGEVYAETVSCATGIDIESIDNFFQLLVKNGLLCTHLFSKEEELDYRKAIHTYNIIKRTAPQTVKEKLPMEVSSAEMLYFNAIEDEGVVSSVMFELTYNCSEQCIHCYNPGATRNDSEQSHRADRKELELNDYKRIIDELNAHGLVKVCLSGGDPFSKPMVWDIIDYLYQKGIAFDVFTNGQRIVDKVEQLANYYPRLVGISIYSGVADDHDAITRVKGSWKRSMEVVKQLSNLAVPLNLKCCIMQANLHSYYLVNNIAQKYGAVPQFEINICDSVEGDKCARRLRLTEEQLQVVLRDNNIPLYVGPEAPNYGGQPRPMDINGCGAAITTFCITPEGNIQPCCSFPMPFGNLKTNSLDAILNNERLTVWRNTILRNYKECGQYEYCAYCNLCPGLAYSEHGDYLCASENCCYMAKVRYHLAQRMKEGYDPLKGQEFVDALHALPIVKVNLQRINHTKG